MEDLTPKAAGSRALAFYRQLVPAGGLCFDVGANVGERTAIFVELGARVVAVEPQPDCRRILRARFDERVQIVDAALGRAPGKAELLVASYHTLSSLAPDWVAEVRESGRFAEFTWDRSQRVPVTTLDALVDAHGVPDFCKIDVEGYELEVVEGLSAPLPVLSFEFTVERREARCSAARHLDALGMRSFNYSPGESLRFEFAEWTDLGGILEFLKAPTHTAQTFGDVYARSGGRFAATGAERKANPISW